MGDTTGSTGVRDAAEDLRRIALGATDASGYFPALYAGVTDRVSQRIDDDGFDDARRMAGFTCEFAQRYLTPRLGEGPPPACWRAAFDVGGDRRLLIVQHLLLGINAHVNFDLPQVVVAVADRAGGLDAVREDFDTINEVLAAQQRAVLAALGGVSRWVNVAAGLGGGRLFHFSLERARDQAWRAATRLWSLDPTGRAAYVRALDELVAVLAYLITQPVRPVGLALPVLRRLETDDPVRVTAALLRA